MKRVALVLPWTGQLPWYWTNWQKSAADRSFDIIVIRKMPEEFSSLIQEKLFNSTVRLPTSTPACKLSTGHKLCDFKPMYGVLFAEELRGYDYWAFGDCDVMYGREFDTWIEKVVAGDYEVATVQQDFIAGPFTLVKNCEKCNRFLRRRRDGAISCCSRRQWPLTNWGRTGSASGLAGIAPMNNYVASRRVFQRSAGVRGMPGSCGSCVSRSFAKRR